MNTSESLGFPWEKIGNSIDNGIGTFTVRTGKHPRNDLSFFLFFYIKTEFSFARRTAEDFYDFFFHVHIPYLVFP